MAGWRGTVESLHAQGGQALVQICDSHDMVVLTDAAWDMRVDALIKALRALGVEGCDVADVLGFVPDDEIASIGEGVYISVPKNLHHMSNPYSDAARAKLRGEGGPKTQ